MDVKPDVPLHWVIRDYLNLTGTKFGCGEGLCGSCTVHVDGKAQRSCLIPVQDAQGKKITTIEGIPEDHPVKKAWIKEQVPQCGYCQPGQIMEAVSLLSEKKSPSDCETSAASVRNKKTGQSFTYGELARKAAELEIPKQPRVKKPGELRLIGTPAARLDIPSKVQGSAEFGIDVQTKDMLYCTVERPPAFGAKSISYDEKSAITVAGVHNVIPIGSGIAVCADSLDAAWKGKKALNVKWDKGISPNLNNETLEKEFLSYLDKDGIVARNSGDIRAALGKAQKKIESVYILPYLSHVNMEPMNCTAYVQKDACDVWVPTQNQTGVLETAKRITGLKPG